VELLDIYPTLVDLCDLPPKPDLDGESLRPLLEDPQGLWDKPAITSNGPDKISVRTERMRYSRFPDGEELYDHDSDPNEWRNLAGQPEYVPAIARLAALLPTEVSRKHVPRWTELSQEQQNLAPIPAGRHRASDAPNDVGLSSDWRTLAE
jgi:arylsulfatase A-like enzyme